MKMKKNLIRVLLFLAITALLITACGGETEGNGPSDEDVINQAYTQAAQTLQASIAQTEAAQPPPTNTTFVLNSPPPPILVTNTSPASPTSPTSAFPTIQPLYTSTPTTQSSQSQSDWIGGRPCLRAELIWENWKDGSQIKPKESFAKIWRLVNSGYCTWTEKFSAIWVDGVNLAGHGIYYFKDFKEFPDDGTPNGTAFDLQISMEAPEQEGHYRSVWKLRDDRANFFGIGVLGDEVFWVDIKVRDR
jgi:hypothetical protein